MDHADFRGLVAARVLDDLDGGERRSVESHVAGCPSCRDLERDLREITGELALAAPIRRAPPELRAAVLDAAHCVPASRRPDPRRP